MPVTRRARKVTREGMARAGSMEPASHTDKEYQYERPRNGAVADNLRMGLSDSCVEQLAKSSKLHTAFVSLERIVNNHSLGTDDTSGLHGAKIRVNDRIAVESDLKGRQRYRPKQNATAPPTSNAIPSKNFTPTRQRNRTLSSQSRQMDPILEVFDKTSSCESSVKGFSEEGGHCYTSPCELSIQTTRRLRPRIHSATSSNETVNLKRNVRSSKPRTRRKPAAPSPNYPDVYSLLSSETDNPCESSEFVNCTSCTTMQSDTNSAGSTMSASLSLPTKSFYSKKSSETPRLITWLQSANKGRSTPAERTIDGAFRTGGAELPYQDIAATDGGFANPQETIKDSKSTDTVLDHSCVSGMSDKVEVKASQNTLPQSFIRKKSILRWSSDCDGRDHITSQPKPARNDKIMLSSESQGFASEKTEFDMKSLSSNASASKLNRSTLKYVNSSTPHPIQHKKTVVEYMFGFENLLEPSASLLQDVSPIPQPPLPKASRKRKEQRAKRLKEKRIEVLNTKKTGAKEKRTLRSRVATAASTKNTVCRETTTATFNDSAISQHYEFTDEDTENETPLFEVTPISPYSPLKIKNVVTSTDKPEKPPTKSAASTGTAKSTVLFNIEEVLPWRDIMEHELVIESA